MRFNEALVALDGCLVENLGRALLGLLHVGNFRRHVPFVENNIPEEPITLG